MRATQYVNLLELAKKILCIPAASVPSERVFSNGALIPIFANITDTDTFHLSIADYWYRYQ